MLLNRSKSILILIVLCLVACKRQNQRKTTNFLLETLNGQVKEVAEDWHCPPVNPNSEFNYCNTNTTTFDENGDPTQTIFALGPSKFAYSRDSLGNKIETRLDFDHAHIYTIAADGRVIKYQVVDFYDYTLYKYDRKKDIVESVAFSYSNDSSKWHIDTTRYIYDNGHHLMEIKTTNKDHKSIYEYKSFDFENNWTKRVSHDIVIMQVRRQNTLKDTMYILADTVTRKITYY